MTMWWNRNKKPQTGRKNQQRRLILESLENRSVLSGFGMAHFHAGPVMQLHVSPTVHQAAPVYQASASQTVSNVALNGLAAKFAAATTTASSSETHLTATLASATNTTAKGTVNYETETHNGTTETELVIKVTGAAASTTLPVAIVDASGKAIVDGSGNPFTLAVTTDASGNGTLSLSSNPSGNQTALPAGFPTLATGFAVTVGADLTGSLATPTETGHGGCHGDGGHNDGGTEAHATRLTATLSDSTTGSTATGTASYKTAEVNGQTVTEVKVSVKGVAGAAAGDKVTVTIGGVDVGSITLDASGNGSLWLSSNTSNPSAQPLPTNFPAITAGTTTVSVGTLSGTFNTAAQTGHRHGHHRH